MQVMQSADEAKITCGACGRETPSSGRFCTSCGVAVKPVPTAAAPAKKVCPGCHRLSDAAATFCLHCGVSLPRAAGPVLFSGPAGFWVRVGASLIDCIIMTIALELLEARLGIVSEVPQNVSPAKTLELLLPSMLFATLMWGIYETVMVGTWGGGVGKLVLRLRVVRSDGGRVPYGLSLSRYMAGFLSLLPLGLGLLWVALSPAKRAWHDYLCDTRVMVKASGA